MRGIDGKTVIVTGGGGGIGAPTCMRFAQEGARVVVMDVNAATAQETVQKIQNSGGQAIACAVDLRDAAKTVGEIALIEKDFGEIDILVNGVGWDVFTPFLKSGPDFWTKIIDINLRSVLNVTHPVLASMVARRSGKIVSLASDAARGGSSGESVYAACKAGIIAFSKTLAREHARHGISVNVVC
ncbi:MAG: SDR family NAD(P)-dependent oxidoreductase, partial [Paracoccaceae bacterium]